MEGRETNKSEKKSPGAESEDPLRRISTLFFLTVRYVLEKFLLFSLNIFDRSTVHLFTCPEQNWSKRFIKSWIQSNFFFGTVADRFGTLFIRPMWFLAMDHVTGHIFKSCKKKNRCQRNIFIYLSFFCSRSIILYSFSIVPFLLYFVENWPYQSDPFQMDIGSERNGSLTEPTEPLNRSEYPLRFF